MRFAGRLLPVASRLPPAAPLLAGDHAREYFTPRVKLIPERGVNELAETTLLTNALLIDCTGGEPRERASIVVEGERIREVRLGGTGPTGTYDTVVDCAGMTLLPGLTDAHVHIGAVDVNKIGRASCRERV